MRSFFLAALTITAVVSESVAKPLHSEPHRVDKKESIEHEISEALKDIDASRNMIRMTVHLNDTSEDIPESFFRDIGDAFSGMFSAIQNTHVPFFTQESIPVVNATSNQTGQDLLTRTRNELKEDIGVLQSRISNIRSDFNEWVISNEHQDFKSMLIGGLSAVIVLLAYYMIRNCCRRRSRLNHLAAFANDGFSAHHNDTESLLPTTKSNKRGRHYPSNSDEDI
uniref:Secreted protein n=1 Tax=Caenorhabditis tropicalis TaxID=1561998 RepID=A0A1I7TKJ4_9PELO